ncbi:MAG: RNA polymerase sigma factor [Phycisphaerae bacterium]|nr:RNA polymerase sigma factor [Phycisphaerae bacterium]
MFVPSLLSPTAAGVGSIGGLGLGVDLAGLLGHGGLPWPTGGAKNSARASTAASEPSARQHRGAQCAKAFDRSTSMPLPMEDWESQTDEALLKAHLDGRDGAFRVLLERYRAELHRFLTMFMGSATAADDVFQDTWVQVHLSGGTFDQERTFKPWLFTVAANKARDHLRRRKRHAMTSIDAPMRGTDGQVALAETLSRNDDSPGDPMGSYDEAQLVKTVVDGLPVHLREILLLGYFHKMPYQQIAETLGIPLGTVKSRLHAAVAAFADAWKRTQSGQDAA